MLTQALCACCPLSRASRVARRAQARAATACSTSSSSRNVMTRYYHDSRARNSKPNGGLGSPQARHDKTTARRAPRNPRNTAQQRATPNKRAKSAKTGTTKAPKPLPGPAQTTRAKGPKVLPGTRAKGTESPPWHMPKARKPSLVSNQRHQTESPPWSPTPQRHTTQRHRKSSLVSPKAHTSVQRPTSNTFSSVRTFYTHAYISYAPPHHSIMGIGATFRHTRHTVTGIQGSCTTGSTSIHKPSIPETESREARMRVSPVKQSFL